MKKPSQGKRIAILSLLLVSGAIGLTYMSLEARRWGRGPGVGVRVGFGPRRAGVRFGIGFGPRRRSWWGRHWHRAGAWIGWRSGVLDDAGQRYWEIANNTDVDVLAISDDNDVMIPAGSSRSLNRKTDFELIVRTENGEETRRSIRRHDVTIGQTRAGRLTIE